MRGRLVSTAAIAALMLGAGGALWWALAGKEPSLEVPEATSVPADAPADLQGRQAATVIVPPAPPPVATVEVAGGEGTVMPVATPETRTLAEETVRDVVAFAEATRSAALLVWQGGALQIEHYADGTRPFDRVDGAGLQAGLMVLLTGQAIRDGFIPDLETPVSTWLPEWADDPRGRIAMRDLVQGTSGLDAPPAPPAGPVAEWTLSATLGAAPGTRYAPATIDLQVLALVLSRATGQPVADYLSTALWQPLGARAAELTLDRPGGDPLTYCCVAATPRDWLRLGLLLAEGGAVEGRQVVPTAWVDAMTKPTLFSRHHGLWTHLVWPVEAEMPFAARERFVEADTLFLAGLGGQRLYVSRGAELVILRLGAVLDDWDESRLPNMVARGIQMPARPERRVPTGQGVELPPITKPPPIPSVEAVPLEPAVGGRQPSTPAPGKP